jgi:formylmethanofuran dehydrogenase subunit E-like metal-binding protein
MAIVSSLTINGDTRNIADAQSRQDIAVLREDLTQEISDRTDAVVSLMNLITQNSSDSSIG